MDMRHTVLTMTRGQAWRMPDWVTYHSLLGFDEFVLILDNPTDDTRAVVEALDVPATVTFIEKAPLGTYLDGYATQREWHDALVTWRGGYPELVAERPAITPISWRQNQWIPEALAQLQSRGHEGWVSVIDEDEFITLGADERIGDLTTVLDDLNVSRGRFLNFNFDTAAVTPGAPVFDQATKRWSREGIEAVGKPWASRTKSIVRVDAALPWHNVHRISKGKAHVFDWNRARLHHFRMPMKRVRNDPGYDVEDTRTAELFRQMATAAAR